MTFKHSFTLSARRTSSLLRISVIDTFLGVALVSPYHTARYKYKLTAREKLTLNSTAAFEQAYGNNFDSFARRLNKVRFRMPGSAKAFWRKRRKSRGSFGRFCRPMAS